MPSNTITYQLAMHYLPNIASRLERLFAAIVQACKETHPIIHHYALKNIIEIIKIIEKPELKSRFIKELMRIEHVINKSSNNTDYANLFVKIQVLQHISGKFGEAIEQDPFLQSIRLAQSSHNNDCELHAPQLINWLSLSALTRQQDLSRWMQKLNVLHETVTMYLTLLRNIAKFNEIIMSNGFYNQPIPNKAACQLILLRMPLHCGMVPKINLGHHGLSIRLCDAISMQDIQQSEAVLELGISGF